EQVVEHLARLRVALELDDHAHAGAVRLVSEVRDAVELAIADHFGDALEQHRLVDLVRQLGDHNLVAIAAIGLLDERLRADDDTSATGSVGRLDALATENGATGREVGPGHDGDQILDRRIGVVDEVRYRVADLAEVVGWHVGRHANGDTGAAVDQQVRNAGWQHG